MDVTNLFKREILRPFLTLAVPGSTATAPSLLVVFYYYPNLFVFWEKHSGFMLTLFILLAMGVGVILDNFSARIEKVFWDDLLDKKHVKDPESTRQHSLEWKAYLGLEYNEKSIAENYLETILLKLKFELGLGFGLFFGWSGLLWYQVIADEWVYWKFCITSLFLLVIYLFFESYSSSDVLGDIRHSILKIRNKLPLPPSKPQQEGE